MNAVLCLVSALLDHPTSLSDQEHSLLDGVKPSGDVSCISDIRESIKAGNDPLGDMFSHLRSRAERRNQGQTFTPNVIVDSMLLRARLDEMECGSFRRIIDPGAGSGRFVIRAADAFPNARLTAIELDPVCALIMRANLAVLGLSERVDVVVDDFFRADIPLEEGRTLYIGNPPYVRHHDLPDFQKNWYAAKCDFFGEPKASKLAGLHMHFFLRAVEMSREGDTCLFVTSSEWLSAKYGHAFRRLLVTVLGGISVHTLDAKAEPFPGTLTTASITMLKPYTPQPSMLFDTIEGCGDLRTLTSGRQIAKKSLMSERRWTPSGAPLKTSNVTHKIGDLFKVSRGQVTGMNDVWLLSPDNNLLPDCYLHPCVTAASEIFAARNRDYRLTERLSFKRLVALPENLNDIPPEYKEAVENFLRMARDKGADVTYVARQRKVWWSIPVPKPAPIICTYMARQRPVFVRNTAGLTLVNIAHGVRPLCPMTESNLDAACAAMNAAVTMGEGRVYAGGLTKFEPSDVESIPISWNGLCLMDV